MRSLAAKLRCKKGQGAVEYALITLLVVIVLVALLNSSPLNGIVSNIFNEVQNKVANV